MRSFSSRFAPIFFIVLLAPCLPARAQVDTEPETRFTLTERLSIGDDESAPIEYLFTGPQNIRTDRAGRIYVHDRRRRSIRVFDQDGELLGSIGRGGEGPGEFAEINAIAIDPQGRLVAYDRMRQRFTRFPPFDEIESFPLPDALETFPNPEDHRFSPQFMYALPDGRFLLFYQPHWDRNRSNPRIHLYDNTFEKVGAFGPIDDWRFPEDDFSDHLIEHFRPFGGSDLSPGETTTLYLAPHIYNGILYAYAIEGESAELSYLDGHAPGHPTHDIIHFEVTPQEELWSRENPSREDRPPGTYSLNSSLGDGRVMISRAILRSQSRGLTALPDGRLLHLSTAEDSNGIRRLQLEVLSPEGELMRVGPVANFEHAETNDEAIIRATSVQLHGADREGRLYVIDRRSGFPVLRVMQLEE